MEQPHVMLRKVARISASSLFMVPTDGDTLDFETISSAPPSHRDVLQRNGLIAKMCVGVTVGNVQSPAEEDAILERVHTPEGRLKLWRDTLLEAELIDASPAGVSVPSLWSKELWPVLSHDEYKSRMHFMALRKSSEEVNDSTYCAPILGLQEHTFTLAATGVRVSLGVVWMPRYSHDLISWSECHLNSGKAVSEQHLMMLIQHLSSGLAALHRGMESALGTLHGSSAPVGVVRAFQECPTNMEIEDVLVMEEDADLTFVVAVSSLRNPTKLASVAREKALHYASLNLYPYLAPEQILPPEVPVGIAKYDVWAIGAMVEAIAGGVPSLASQLRRDCKRKGADALPLNHPAMSPSAILRRIRHDLKVGNYTSQLQSLVGLLLSPDVRTRPSLETVETMMLDLNRAMPILRFPFSIGSFELIRLPVPENIQLNPGARKYITKDTCCLCKRERNLTRCKDQDHAPAITSPSWSSDEDLLPGMAIADPAPGRSLLMTYLYPLIPNMEDRERRKVVSQALCVNSGGLTSVNMSTTTNSDAPSLDRAALLQLFGGFAIYERVPSVDNKKDRIVVRDVYVPYPCNALRRCELPWSVHQLHFTGALPWPSCCTAQLQKRGRLSLEIPFMFHGLSREVQWFAWIVPGEIFVLDDGREWVATEDGGFVFLFGPELEPTDQDRYFSCTSVRSMTNAAKVSRTVLPDNVFRRHVGDEPLPSASALTSKQLSLSADFTGRGRGIMAAGETSAATSPGHSAKALRHLILEPEDALPARERSCSVILSSPYPDPTRSLSGGNGGALTSSEDRTSGARSRSSRRAPQGQQIRGRQAPRVSAFGGEEAEILPGSSEERGIDVFATGVTSSCATPNYERKHEREAATAPPAMKPETLQSPPKMPAYRRLSAANAERNSMLSPSTPKRTVAPEVAPLSHVHPNSVGTLSASAKKKEPLLALNASISTNASYTPIQHLRHHLACDAVMANLAVFARSYPPEVMDAPFGSLTFWVHSSGEHGTIQPPVALNNDTRYALMAPTTANYVAFLSNQMPLLHRNHPNQPLGGAPLLPNHGFVFYTADFATCGVLALRCDVSGSAQLGSEFCVALKPLPPLTSLSSSSALSAMKYFVSYFHDESAWKAAGPHAQRLSTGGICHSQLLSARSQQSEDADDPAGAHCCWVGYDPDAATLLFSNQSRSPWYPFRLTSPE